MEHTGCSFLKVILNNKMILLHKFITRADANVKYKWNDRPSQEYEVWNSSDSGKPSLEQVPEWCNLSEVRWRG